MKKYIHVTADDRKYLARLFNVTDMAISKALRFMSDSEISKRIRKAAKERGGIVMVVAPGIETFHDSDNVMRQYCPNGALIELSRKDNTGDVIFKGHRMKHYDGVMLSDIAGIQRFAMTLR